MYIILINMTMQILTTYSFGYWRLVDISIYFGKHVYLICKRKFINMSFARIHRPSRIFFVTIYIINNFTYSSMCLKLL